MSIKFLWSCKSFAISLQRLKSTKQMIIYNNLKSLDTHI